MKDTWIDHQNNLQHRGFSVVNNIFSEDELKGMLTLLADLIATDNPLFRRTADLFAIRQFLKVQPQMKRLVFNSKIANLISSLFGDEYFIVKSIYFDKPPQSNWFVACHQDLTISVKEKIEMQGFGPWTVKQGQFAVQPPLSILEDNFTLRIHLDDTTAENGALKVIPGSHLKGIFRPETVDRQNEREEFCEVEKGGVMLMKPLLLHASNRSINKERRRVIHIEFSRKELPGNMTWAERDEYTFPVVNN